MSNPSRMTIGIIGQGFVGSAVREGMRDSMDVLTFDIKTPHTVFYYSGKDECSYRVDDRYKFTVDYLVDHVTGPIFLCLPTPMNEDGRCNIGMLDVGVYDVNDAAERANKIVAVVIKSTIPPGTTREFSKKYNNCFFCFNPEFLTEANAIEDYKNQDRIILGLIEDISLESLIFYRTFQRAFSPDVPIIETSAEIAEMVKYTTNGFLASKVSFANEIEQICNKSGIDYNMMIKIAKMDKRLGGSHWQVPGPDSHKGFGGSCFIKDLNALMCVAKDLGVDPKVMRGVWEKNLEVRPERDWEQLKGRAVSH